jgi:hypothetical protein
VTALLMPLVLAAVLSVVSVRAARSGPVLVASPSVIASPPPSRARPSGRQLAGAGIVAAVVVGLVALAGQGERHSGGDPGGRILADLKTATVAVPTDAQVLSHEEVEPSWVACDRAGGSGWTEARASVQFSTRRAQSQLIDGVDRQLAGRGWRTADASGAGAAWTKALAGDGQAQAALVPAERSGVWWLRLSAPAQGARFAGDC